LSLSAYIVLPKKLTRLSLIYSCALDLKRMFKLLSRLKDGVVPMLQVIEDFIKASGLDAVQALAASVCYSFMNPHFIRTQT
jgi:hypothetical protein